MRQETISDRLTDSFVSSKIHKCSRLVTFTGIISFHQFLFEIFRALTESHEC